MDTYGRQKKRGKKVKLKKRELVIMLGIALLPSDSWSPRENAISCWASSGKKHGFNVNATQYVLNVGTSDLLQRM